ncbi:hypothetical protein [Sphingomonas sp.]|uniref:PD-(D/E)XK nuclease domain-containing protein n=1 Tax=Sphingomonas sp. TaxID=28214 RepID=UPI00121DDB23|nr:MAG: hypothetical protein EOP66_02960 [Sphingomonas sp.]
MTDDELTWASESAAYLREVRRTAHNEFTAAMENFKGNENRGQDWFHEGKSCILAIYHYSEEFAPDPTVPGACFSSPGHFSSKLDEYEAFVVSMQDKLQRTLRKFIKKSGPTMPYQATDLLELLFRLRTAIEFVRSRGPRRLSPATNDARTIVKRAARQFHESVLALRRHPHGGEALAIKNEWDCQYLFKSILAALVHDIRMEEWSPSVGGSSARCEFLLKSHRLMIELKYARAKADGKAFKTGLLTDFRDYGGHPDVDAVVVLIYDPTQVLEHAVQLQADLSVPTNGLSEVAVIVSPPRSADGV